MNEWVNTGLRAYRPQNQEMIRAPSWACLVPQWWRILLPTQETRVRSPVREDSTSCGATNGACVPQLLSLCPRALQQERPPWWEISTRCSLHSMQLEKSLRSNEDPAQPKRNKYLKNKLLLPYSWLQWFSPGGDFWPSSTPPTIWPRLETHLLVTA